MQLPVVSNFHKASALPETGFSMPRILGNWTKLTCRPADGPVPVHILAPAAATVASCMQKAAAKSTTKIGMQACAGMQAAVEEGIVIGGGCTLLKLAQKVDAIKASLEVDEQRIGAEIVRRALGAPLKLIANNAGINGAVVMQKVCLCYKFFSG